MAMPAASRAGSVERASRYAERDGETGASGGCLETAWRSEKRDGKPSCAKAASPMRASPYHIRRGEGRDGEAGGVEGGHVWLVWCGRARWQALGTGRARFERE